MYRSRPWTMRQIAGFGTPQETNQRFQYLIAQGQTGISVDFDMPTLMGYDSDDPQVRRRGRPRGRRHRRARGHGAALRRHRPRADHRLDDDQPERLDPARDVHRGGRGARAGPRQALRDDPERHPQGVHRAEGVDLPAAPSMRIVRDTITYAAEHLPRTTRSTSAGTTSPRRGERRPQEAAFTMAAPRGMSDEVTATGIDVDEFAPGCRSSSSPRRTSSRRSRSSGRCAASTRR